ncbi:flagellar biosynthesis anti-sigma factor FlgM [Thiorhodovibrio frisius]|uniref:Negative regulator of flagellin synthesis n=1 Tax=Thiorhodovibrio frisius TaxID=631362 RepID=H8YZN8_9GAMM|nr:flagellar biosynthesis anti-sigma factor FlgM [Thiorhodovibrio frisius]EIC22165.1 flagellar biosynthesis anti-sigma factor FlgM [Thiorhodovibrio frisius]WPL24459.1 flagellar biosynthesis anti-sigma factor FlgM [Thiorhodovibrio frisius]
MDIKNLGVNKGRAERTGSSSASRSSSSAGTSSAGKSGAAGKAAAQSAGAGQGESIELTAIARALSAAQADAANPPFDAERVQEIRDAISEGRYPIDNRRLADKLIELEGLLD